MGTDMLVDVDVDGRKVPMIFDTGAEGCLFTTQQWSQMGKSIPDDARMGSNVGIAGSTSSANFTIDTMRLGPIIKHDVLVSVVQDSKIGYPLLGNSFFGDLQFEVDNSSHLIRIRY